MDKCAETGNLKLLMWMRHKGHPWDWKVCAYAAENGHLDILKWARSTVPPAPINEWAFALAVQKEQIEVINWLYHHKAPWDWMVCSNAAATGNLELLKWLKVLGAPWDWMTCAMARHYKHKELYQWAIEHGCPENKEMENVYFIHIFYP